MKMLIPLLLLLSGCGGVADSPTACAFVPVADLHLTFENNVPLVDVEINGQKLQFLFDTGAVGTVVGLVTARRLGLPDDPVLRSFTTVLNGVTAHRNAMVDSFAFSSVRRGNTSLAVIDLGPLANGRASGMLGGDILGDYDVELDLPHHRVALYQPRNCPSQPTNWGRPGVPLPRPPLGRVFPPTAISLEVNGVAHTAIIDSGASYSAVSLEAATASGVTPAMLVADRHLTGQSASKATAGMAAHRFDNMTVGGEIIEKPLIAVVTQPNAFGDLRIAGLLGNDYLRGHRVWISYGTYTAYAERP